jgi:ABC-type uncharacterized transport system substrate-binding protein
MILQLSAAMGFSRLPEVFIQKIRQPQTARRRLPLLLVILALTVSACSRAPGPVAIFASPDAPRLRQTVAQIKLKLGKTPTTAVYVPQFGPRGTAALRRLQQRHPRLLVVLGTPALLRVPPLIKDLPVVFGLVANPFFTGAAYLPAHPEIHQENITGIYTPAPLKAALQHGVSLLGPRPWGLLYDPTDGVAADLARRFRQIAPRLGVKPLTATSTTAATDASALENLLKRGARIIYLPPAASTARYAPLVLNWGRELRVPVVSSLPEGSHQGAALWVAVDYRRLGVEIGSLALRVLAGENPKAIPITKKIPLRVATDDILLRHWSGYPPLIK